ncbi:MAG: hypothetical protein Q7T40_03300 [Methylobacter sp.]|nr:hypothetical protein [Methylobacter sp.]
MSPSLISSSGRSLERGKNAARILARSLRSLGWGVLLHTASGDDSGMQAQFLARPRCELIVQILGGIGESGKNDDLAIARIERIERLLFDSLA